MWFECRRVQAVHKAVTGIGAMIRAARFHLTLVRREILWFRWAGAAGIRGRVFLEDVENAVKFAVGAEFVCGLPKRLSADERLRKAKPRDGPERPSSMVVGELLSPVLRAGWGWCCRGRSTGAGRDRNERWEQARHGLS